MMNFPKLNACSIDLTEGCNLACTYCFTHSEHKSRVIEEQMAKTIIDFFIHNSLWTDGKEVGIDWWGGEPLLEWKLLKKLQLWALQEYGRLRFNGTTNGVLYTPAKVEWLQEHNSHFMVSIDGIEKTHDSARCFPNGKGSWKIVDKNLRKAKEIRGDQGVRLSLSLKVLPHFFESMQYFIEDIGLTNIAYSPVFEDNWNEEAFDLLKDQFSKIIPYLKEHKNVRVKHLDDACRADGQKKGFQLPCGAGRTYIGFSIDGFIYPCHRFNKHGRTTEQRIKDPARIGEPTPEGGIKWCNSQWRNQFNEYQVNQKCQKCNIYGVTCNGICYAVQYDLTGMINERPDKICDYYKIENQAGRQLVERLYTPGVLAVGNALELLVKGETIPEAENKILEHCIKVLKDDYQKEDPPRSQSC